MGVLEKKETVAASAERKAKRDRRRKKAKLQHGGSSSLFPVDVEDVKVEGPPPVPAGTADEAIVL